MLICLPFLFCADKTRNVQSIVGLNIKKRTAKLLEKPKAVHSWKHFLSERVLKTTPFRRNDLLGSCYVWLIRQFTSLFLFWNKIVCRSRHEERNFSDKLGCRQLSEEEAKAIEKEKEKGNLRGKLLRSTNPQKVKVSISWLTPTSRWLRGLMKMIFQSLATISSPKRGSSCRSLLMVRVFSSRKIY